MKVTTEVLGIPNVRTALRVLQPETQKRLSMEVRVTAARVVAGAKARVHVRSGELKDTIRGDSSSDGLVAFVKAGYGTLKRRSRAKVGSKRRRRGSAKRLGPVEPGIYAMVEEFGSQTNQAHPYMFPALEAERQDHISRSDRALKGAVAAADGAAS
jgi:hypothetical protein